MVFVKTAYSSHKKCLICNQTRNLWQIKIVQVNIIVSNYYLNIININNNKKNNKWPWTARPWLDSVGLGHILMLNSFDITYFAITKNSF